MDRKKVILKVMAMAAVTLLIVAFCAMVTPASANTRVYSSDSKRIGWLHFGLVYNVPLSVNENAYIGGVDQATLDRYAPEHRNVQEWDRKSYGSDRSVLLIPKRYVIHRWYYKSEIYLVLNPTPNKYLSADLNCDNKVNIVDYAILMSFWEKDPSGADSCQSPDINQDGKVDLTDFSIMMSQWTEVP